MEAFDDDAMNNADFNRYFRNQHQLLLALNRHVAFVLKHKFDLSK
jgi:hypothetical protein